MKTRSLAACLLCLLPAFSPAQQLDFNAVRSAEQLRRGVQAFHRGFYNDALVSLEKAIGYQPSNTHAQVWLGRTLWKSGYEQEAIRTWSQVAASGKGDALLREWIRVIGLRSGLGRELQGNATWVVASELDGTLKGGYAFRTALEHPCASRRDVLGRRVRLQRGAALRRRLQALAAMQGRAGRVRSAVRCPGGGRTGRCTSRNTAPTGSRNARRVGKRSRPSAGTGRAEGLLLGPQYLALDGRGYLWVSDWGNSRVARYDLDGNYIQSITGINGPTGIAVRDNRIYIGEKTGKRILVYDLDGNSLGTLGDDTLTGPGRHLLHPEWPAACR